MTPEEFFQNLKKDLKKYNVRVVKATPKKESESPPEVLYVAARGPSPSTSIKTPEDG
jgi:hypothetical protein